MKHLGSALLLIISAIVPTSVRGAQGASTADSFKTQQGSLSQASLDELTTRLNYSFKAVGDARNGKGYVHDKAVLKAHENDLKTFRTALQHNRITFGDERKPDKPNREAQSLKDRRREISVALRHVADSFNAFEQANDEPGNPNIVLAMRINEAYAAEGRALQELDDTKAHIRF